MLRKLLLLFIVLMSSVIYAQTLYWVGGSGNFNDKHHWALTSGGLPASITPNPTSDLIFDDNSSTNDLVINITGLNHIKSLKVQNQNNNYHFTGSNLSILNCSGDFVLNEKTYFEANTKLIFSSTSLNYHVVNFWKNIVNTDVLFEDGNWDLQSIKISDNNLLKINKGNYKTFKASVIAGNLESIDNNVTFQVTHSTFYIKNRITLGSNVAFNATDLVLIAQKNNPTLYKVNQAVNFGSNAKVFNTNPNPQACSITYTFTNPSCFGSCDASISIGFDAGCNTGPYDILFNNSSGCFPSGANGILPPTYGLNSLCSCGGLLDIFVFDGVGFVTQLTGLTTPQAPTPLNLMFSSPVQPRCFGNCDGSVSIFSSGGSPPYDITVLSSPSGSVVSTHTNIPAVTTTTVGGLCAGTFSFVVTDDKNCSRTFTTTLTQPPVVNPNASATNITCNGVCNGSVTTTASGGVGPYSYSWTSASSTPSSVATSTMGNLCPGVVTMTVTDSKTCTATFSTTITQPPPITLTVTHTDLNCGNVCNGTSSVSATGGLGPFSYSWSPSGGSAAQATGLCAGNYTCTVTNNGNCVKTITVTISSPPAITITPTQKDILCNAVCNGSVNLNPTGGTPGFSYNWLPNVSNTVTATGLCAGVYNYTVTDALGCKVTNTITITQPPATTLTISNTSVTCNGACDGTATGNMSGGTLPYTYSWTPSASTLSTITNLCPNTYTLKVTDGNSCVITQTTVISQPIPISVVVTSVSPTCNGQCNGSINAVPAGGVAPYSYTLQSTAGAPITSNPPYSNLCAGSYTLITKDTKGCSKISIINLTQPNPITLALTSTQINCFNVCNASVSTVVNGGTPLYTYSWSVGGTSSSISNQCVGAITATVTDANGCSVSSSTVITSQSDLTVSIVPTNPNCNAQCTGIATTSVSGGVPNYTINWNNGSVGNIINNLCVGTYTATVTDFFGCIKTQTVAIITPPALTLTATNGTVSCAGSCDGTVSVTPSGGTPGYFYSWNSTPPQTTPIANGLCVGNYVASVTDSKGCIASIAANVSQPPVLTASVSNVQPSCNVCIGSATAHGIGGNPPYTYAWSGGQTTQTANNLCVGTQTVIVTDAKGCTTTQTVQINQTVIVLVTTNGSTLACNNSCSGIATANPSGGAGPYSYTWTPAPLQSSQTASGLCAGTHTVMVSDANGCSNTGTVNFSNPPAITLTVNKTDVTCHGLCNGTANAIASGGTGAITYVWQPGNFSTQNISSLCPGNYTVTATDFNNCSQTQIVTIAETNSLTASFTFTNPTTCTSTDGTILANISGGTPLYTFTWTPPGSANINPLTNIGAGTYSLSIKDGAGCTQTIVTTLSNPTGPTVTATSNSITCFGVCNGSATISIVGSGPFTVNGSAIVGNTTTLSGLCSGITTPVIMDANSCVTNQTINIVAPAQLLANGVASNVSCNTACTASINLTPTGGTLPYSFAWSPAGSGEDQTNLCAGNYSVTITDGNNCSITNSFVVTQPTSLTINFNKKDVLCNGNCTGGTRALVTGGTAPYSYTWTPSGSFPGSNLDTIVNICAGIYTVNVKDINGCIISGTVIIGEPVALTSTITAVNVKCNGQCNGSAIINASGGTAPYVYNYNTTPITPTQAISGLCVGSYTGNVTDANGCLSSANFNITQPLPIVVTTTINNPTCNAVCNGSVTTNVTGGSPNYSYNWIPSGGPVQNPNGLCAGNYTVVVTDDSLCTGQGLVVLTDPIILIANISFTNPTCNSVCNGVVTANPIGGTAPFSYSWATPAINTNTTVSNLCAGNYTLTLTDANSCQNIQTVTLTDPTAVAVNPAITPATCGFNNGSINAVGINGVSPYTYNWLPPVSGAQSTNTVVTGLGAGVYTVVVTDASACSSTISIPLSNSNGPSGATITSTNVTCNAQCNGAATISNPVGGTAPYILSWINPVSASSSISNLCANTYTAQIEDANNCLFFQSVTITEPQTIDDNEIITGAACLGNCNGAIALNPSGGNGGYTYSWSPAAITGTISNVCPGAYTATITDVQGCTLVANYILPSITTITSSTFATNNTCFGDCNGSLLATNVAGGLPPYSFNWSDPAGQSTAVASGLCNGNYSVTIKDANGCLNVLPANVSSPSPVTFTPTVTQPNCGLCDGAALINPSGGTPSYSYIWTIPGQTTNSVSNLCAGVYDVQITDGNGCVTNSNVIINSSSSITGETIVSADASCSGTCDGSVTVTAIGGTGIISYHWLHNNSTSQTLTGLCAGTYLCNMTDANGCSRTASVVINAVTNFTITPQITQSSCSTNDGSITLGVVGGTGVYTYVWLPAAPNTATVTNLAPGNYTVTVSDGNCSQTQVYAINSINGPIVSAFQNNITCNGICDGSISLIISGGTPNYTTSWSNGATTPNINGLCAGAYSYTITDAAGCKAVRNFSLTTNTPIVFSVPDIDNPLCNNNCNGVITTIPSGGALPYTFSWIVSTSTTSIANALCAGNYSVIVSDANGCSSTEGYTLTGPSTISVTAVLSDVTCNALATGSINITVTGGTPGPGYTYSWTPTGVITEDLNGISAGTYSVVITDNNGCNVDSSFVINEPTVIDDNEIITAAACFGNCNGSIALNPTGGNGGYTYSWTPSANTGTVTNLCPGPQTATITDSNGCTFVGNYNVPSLTTITSTTLGTNNICFSDCNGVLTATNIAGGVAPYTIIWNDPLGQPGNTATGLCTGNYSVTITDANGCFNQIPANVGSTSPITFTPTITQPSCDLCNGVATINPVGGTPGYTYQWSNNETTNSATNLCAGVYSLNITDANGCLTSTNVVVNSSSGITGETIVSTDVTCEGSCDGTANVTAVGGVAPITYNWVHNNSSSQSVANLCAGTYFCNMVDANGCSRTTSVVINALTTLTISSQVTQSSCTVNTGSVVVNVSGGTGVYTYAWLPAGTTNSITNLAPGNYTLTVSDGNCSKTEIYSIVAINAPVLTSTIKNVSCNALCDGNISLTISGGTPTYTTLWSNGASTSSITALCSGSYSVEVTDAVGCKAVKNFSINTVSPIVFSAPDLDNPQCHDDCNGSLTVIPIGGTMPYTFLWIPNNVNTATTNSLCTGNYSVTVTDANGCPASNTYSLINPPTLTLTAVPTDASCNTALDGSIDITMTGGVPAYSYSWLPGGATTEDLVNVLSGTYTVSVTDNFGCVKDSVLTINSTLTVNAIAGNDTLFCQNGTLLLDGSNSNGGVTYQWTEIPSGSIVSNTLITTVTPATGTNTYVLTATNGVCIDMDTIVVTSHALPNVDAGPMVSMPIFSSAGIGGSPTCATGVTFNWSPVTALDNPTATNPTSGTTVTTIYTVTVIDNNGCTNSDTVTVFIYPQITIPNGFSPNGDGKNDVWQIDFIYQFPDCEVEVYNRWGERLFYSKGYAVPFNGQYKGKDLPVGTYYYVINLNHPAFPDAYTSPLTIFR